jgi:hypothetical protein
MKGPTPLLLLMVIMLISWGIHVGMTGEYNYDRFPELDKLHSHLATTIGTRDSFPLE